ncbi:MAG: thermonuclease family protein [Elusimicrobia bacterium]|nr:thermonuclease family protein [Elusimicrobiota bacterium]
MSLPSLLLVLAFTAAAHPGGVDKDGCHADKAAGSRHCHSERAAGASAPAKQAFEGKVVSVKDGDTVEVVRSGKAARIRLAEVDAPEKSQAYGQQAKKFLSDLVFGRQVQVWVTDTDRYGRLVARLTLPDGRDVNRELVKAGFAWWYKRYSKDASLGALQDEARAAKRGLWADPAPVEPWLFRRKAGGRV